MHSVQALLLASAAGLVVSCSSAAQSATSVAVPAPTTTSTFAWSGYTATPDTEMVYGRWADTVEQRLEDGRQDGVETVTVRFTESLVTSDPRSSGSTDYTVTLYVPDPASRTGGQWIVKEAAISNDDGAWVGYAFGSYTYKENLPDSLTNQSVVIAGEWHLVGTDAYEGLRLDFYSATGVGVVGTINPID